MTISTAIDDLRFHGFDPCPKPIPIRIPNAKQVLLDTLNYFTNNHAQWLPAYDEIAAWLTDNQQRGLLCVGPCGLGKTLICCNVIPTIIYQYYQKILIAVDAIELNNPDKNYSRYKQLVIDDIGTEPESVRYGERHVIFSELVDAAEKKGNLLIITTNLMTATPKGQPADFPSIEARYGLRTLDRLRAITKVVRFDGKSFRK